MCFNSKSFILGGIWFAPFSSELKHSLISDSHVLISTAQIQKTYFLRSKHNQIVCLEAQFAVHYKPIISNTINQPGKLVYL